MLKSFWALALGVVLFTPYVNAKSMTQFYGTQKYNGSYDFNDLKRSMVTDSTYDNRIGFKGLAAYGMHVNVKITEVGSDIPIVDKQKIRQYVHTIAFKDDNNALTSLNTCKYYHSIVIDQESDDVMNLKVAAEELPKWRIFREPVQLRKTRYKIYFNQRAVRILNQRIKKAVDDNRIKLLKRVREHFKTKVAVLYDMHDHLMEEHDLPWKPRRWVWAGFTKNSAYCYLGESFNPEEWYEVKKEINRVEEKIKKVVEESKPE